ncbi:glycosyltransferase family 9 protein [Chryseosolibacter indicus]|uniref:Glycosyltransferase family 9 protein n=1 Tax=Chryseosolibacter indicus TaxID=2782351 RepID=A0ABS5VSG5_9BACT|nr:glycosyltransferase family 9 protein [Chryseosolibacter indicus]MBT1703814.1 glycosyltransferase family 9 protein [Chryseosolibacter indicus]
MKRFDETSIKKVGIFRALYLGDMLCIIPMVRAMRHAYPHAHITLIGLRWQKDFVKRFSHYFDDFMEFPGWPGLPEQQPDENSIADFLTRVRTYEFDLVLQMQGNGIITNSMCLSWGAKQVAGLRRSEQHYHDDTLFPVSEDTDHEVLRFLKLADALAIPHQGAELEFPFLEEEIQNYQSIVNTLQLHNKYICIHAGARDVRRRWPVDNFAFVANQLALKGYKLVLTGSMDEEELLKDLQNKIDAPVVNIVDRLGQVPLGELGLILNNCSMLLSNDTGVSHVASALKVPSVVVFSPFSDMQRWAPLQTSLHKIILFEQAKDPEFVLYTVLDQLEKIQTSNTSNEFSSQPLGLAR